MPIFYRIPIQGKTIPCTIKLKYHSYGDLSIAVDLTNKEPEPGKCMNYLVGRPNKLEIRPRVEKQLKEYQLPFAYLSLESDTGVNITI